MSDQPKAARPVVAASYARKSNSDPIGLQAQHAINEKSAQSNGHQLPRSGSFRFEDDFTTGKSKDRKGLNRLMGLVVSDNAPFSVLYVKDDERFGRWSNIRERSAFEQILLDHGVRLYYGDTPITVYDETSADSTIGPEVVELLKSCYAAEEWRKILVRMMAGKADRVRRGFYPGAQAPYGLVPWVADMTTGNYLRPVTAGRASASEGTAIVLREATDGSAAIVREIFERVATGEALRLITADLRVRNVPSPGSRQEVCARPWRESAARSILKNTLYKGELIWGQDSRLRKGEIVDVDSVNINTCRQPLRQSKMRGDHLVSPELWHKAQVESGNHPGRRYPHTGEGKYLLSGLLRCTSCNAPLTGHTSIKGEKSRRRYYKHERRKDGYQTCGVSRTYIPADALEGAVLQLVNDLLALPELESAVHVEIERMLALVSTTDNTKQRSILEAEQKRLTVLLRNACRAKIEAENDPARDVYTATENELGASLVHVATELDRLDKAPEYLATAAERFTRTRSTWPKPEHLFAGAAFDDRRRCLGSILSRIKVAPDSGEIVLHAQVE